MTLKSIIGKCKSHATTLIWLVALVVTAGVLLGYERHVLWKIQEQNLFLDTPLFFRQLMVVPGGLLSYIGSFLTQLLFYPVLGVAVLCALWWLLMWLMRRTFQVSERWAPLLLVPVALLLAANVDMGYWIYPIKLRGWYFDATIGVTAVVALLWGYRKLSAHRLWRRVLLVVTTVAGYPLLGTYALTATVLMALWSWRLDRDRWQSLADSVLAVLAGVAVPLLCYQYVYHQMNIVNLWWTGLPTFKILETNSEYYVPYALLGVCLVGSVVCGGRSKEEGVRSKETGGLWQTAFVGLVLAATVVGVWKAWMKDENFHREAAMQYYVEQTRWEDVLEEAAKQQDVPTRSIVMMRNLALSRLGRQGSEMYRYANGSKKPDSPFAPPASMIVGDMIYYHYGMLNDCHHMCIEGGVEFGWRVQHLKYMARCGLMAGEVNSMLKYTELLKHTLFHGQWAKHLESLQQQPELKRADSETGPVMHMLQYPDIVGTDHGYAERYLMNHLAEMDSDDPYFQEQCLLATLWTKNSKQFWPRFAKYLSLHKGEPIPRYYREAAYLYSVIEENPPFDVKADDNMKRSFQEFAELAQRFDGRDVKEARAVMYPLFGDTYFFEFFLMGDLAYL
ncbi:MAG: hypothetical protein IJ569_07240 [Prevotella sp.]|nr:hypothetical protein [Prevotella sp.]